MAKNTIEISQSLYHRLISNLIHRKGDNVICTKCKSSFIPNDAAGNESYELYKQLVKLPLQEEISENKVISIGNLTRLDGSPDRILQAALGQLDGVVIVGYTHDDTLWAASSYADGGTVMWLLEACKQKMMEALPENAAIDD